MRGNHKAVSGMSLASVETVERVNGDTWKVKAVYEADEDGGGGGDASSDEEDATVFAFDTGGGTKHLNQSIRTDGKYPSDAPDFGGAIGVDNEGNVNGVDVTMPVLNFTETHVLAGSRVTTSYRKTLADLTGTVNRAGFRGFAPGETGPVYVCGDFFFDCAPDYECDDASLIAYDFKAKRFLPVGSPNSLVIGASLFPTPKDSKFVGFALNA